MIVLLGTDHKHQRSGTKCVGPDEFLNIEREQKDHFRKTIEGLLADKSIGFVAEEINDGEETIAHEMADKRGIGYAVVDMTPEEREAAGIPNGYADEGGPHSQEDINRWHAQREKHMLDQTQAQRRGTNNVLMIVGLGHLEGLQELTGASAEDVEICDLRERGWFIIDWAQEYLRR